MTAINTCFVPRKKWHYFSCILWVQLLILVFFTSVFAQDSPPDRTIELKAISGLKYDKVRFVVQPSATIKIKLTNVDEMPHNMLVVKPGTRENVVKQAEALGDDGPEQDYNPLSSDVLASIPLLNPDESGSVILKIPDNEGVYPYVCTFPAHGRVMYGAMYVTTNSDTLPPIQEDTHIPKSQRTAIDSDRTKTSPHPYSMIMPQITRIFMPDASPAAIAVGLEQNLSYCWDASVCHMRYSWKGGYIDATETWKYKTKEVPEIIGEVYFRNKVGFPLRIAEKDSIPEPNFKGYKMIDDYPQFIYTIGDTKVQELITPLSTGKGVKISYQLKGVEQPIWYKKSNQPGITVKSSKGIWDENLLKLTPQQATSFTISISAD